MKRWAAGIALGALAFDASARAADIELKAPAPAATSNWTGFYLGGHAGYGGGSFGPGTNPVPEQGVVFPPTVTGLIGGYQIGYNRQLSSHVVIGAEADALFTSQPDRPRLALAPYNTGLDYVATARGRIGYAFNTLMPFATAGLALGATRIDLNDAAGNVISSRDRGHLGWTAGLGVEFAVGGNWSAKLEYDVIDLARQTYDLSDAGLPRVNVDPRIYALKFGLNYHLGDLAPLAAADTALARPLLPESPNWNIHGQATFIPDAYPGFRSPYQAANSLPGGGEVRETFTSTAFLGWRLWQGGEFYFDPEVTQGFGFNGTRGVAGFPNGEAQKAGGTFPKFRPQRYFLRETFGLGGEQEDVADGPNQLAGTRDIDRVTVTVGRFAVGDFFDGNAYAKDPRADFMNWAIWSSAAYDFPADLPGYTRGAVVELNRKDWALRAGVFEVPDAPNSDALTFKGAGTVVELEERYAIGGQPGKLRIGGFANSGNTGNYRDALAVYSADPMIDINAIITGMRRDRFKYGAYLNAEQQVARDVGLFARASWNDGQNEILSFTDIDRSVSGGVSIKGNSWARPNDTIGVGGAVNGLSNAHRDFLAAGGNGILIGDGRLNYRTERILEAYYAYALNKTVTLTADYQLITNPAYNADRGPVSVFSGRLHGEF